MEGALGEKLRIEYFHLQVSDLQKSVQKNLRAESANAPLLE